MNHWSSFAMFLSMFFLFSTFILSHDSCLLIYFEILKIIQNQLSLTVTSGDHSVKTPAIRAGSSSSGCPGLCPDIKYLQGQRLHITSGQPAPVSDHLAPCSQPALPLTNIVRVSTLLTALPQITVLLVEPRGGVTLAFKRHLHHCLPDDQDTEGLQQPSTALLLVLCWLSVIWMSWSLGTLLLIFLTALITFVL